jgi:hypothetical protein
MWNIDFSNVSVTSGVLSPFSLKRINQLELAVLTCLNFAVAIPASEYAKYYYLLRNMMIRGGLLDLSIVAQRNHYFNGELSKDQAHRLEHRTCHYQDIINDAPRRRQSRSVDWTGNLGGRNQEEHPVANRISGANNKMNAVISTHH